MASITGIGIRGSGIGGSSVVGSSVLGTSVVGYWGSSVVGYWGSSIVSHGGSGIGHSGGSSNNGGLVDGSRVHGVSRLGHHSVEAVDGISGVVDGTGGAIGLQKTVLSLDDISVTVLALALMVSGMGVANSVVERVLGEFGRIEECQDLFYYEIYAKR
ncbi:hypothetical protein B566_EDAN016383 [Ephemera danica]|nr:hypothetical protein B566_EDAN016383 [Ephemera danica]